MESSSISTYYAEQHSFNLKVSSLDYTFHYAQPFTGFQLATTLEFVLSSPSTSSTT